MEERVCVLKFIFQLVVKLDGLNLRPSVVPTCTKHNGKQNLWHSVHF